MSLAERARSSIASALEGLARAGELGEQGARALEGAAWAVERPKRADHGDLATNVAMALTKRVGQPPRAIAEALVRALVGSDVIRSAEIAGPGFVNLRLHASAFHAELMEILRGGVAWGRAPAATGERVNLEFVSANPTGPVTVASGRNAVYGDTVGRLLEAAGARVTREYYINDRGNQVRMFAESVRAAAAGREPPEDGYKGAYVGELAKWFEKRRPERLTGDVEALGRECVTWMLRGIPGSATLPGIRPSLAALRVNFDVWFSEESLHRWGAVEAVMAELQARGCLERKDGALFFKAPEGAIEDKDRVVQKSDGTWAYFASDVAYFADKVARGYDRLMIVLGADHHGYVARVRNSLVALGLPEERFEALLYQLVFITKGGVTVGIESRVHPDGLKPDDWAKLAHPDELAMAHRLGDFPDVLSEAARQREPHRIVFYVQELARDFQSYFTRLKGEKGPILPPAPLRAEPGWEKRWDFAKTRARLAWIEALRIVYSNALSLIGVSAPERMDQAELGEQGPMEAEGEDL